MAPSDTLCADAAECANGTAHAQAHGAPRAASVRWLRCLAAGLAVVLASSACHLIGDAGSSRRPADQPLTVTYELRDIAGGDGARAFEICQNAVAVTRTAPDSQKVYSVLVPISEHDRAQLGSSFDDARAWTAKHSSACADMPMIRLADAAGHEQAACAEDGTPPTLLEGRLEELLESSGRVHADIGQQWRIDVAPIDGSTPGDSYTIQGRSFRELSVATGGRGASTASSSAGAGATMPEKVLAEINAVAAQQGRAPCSDAAEKVTITRTDAPGPTITVDACPRSAAAQLVADLRGP